jgi:hypothetical protein
MLRIVCALVVVALGIAMSVMEFVTGNWLSALSAIISGLAFVIVILAAREFPIFILVAGVATVLGIIAIVHEHRAFDPELTSARDDAMFAFVDADSCKYSSSETHLLFEEGLKACSIQSYRDLIDAIFRLQKSIYLPPEVAFFDQLQDSVKGGIIDWCAAIYVEASKLCPRSFMGVSKKSDCALRKANS